MATNRQRVQHYIRAFDFKRLFVDELGWDNLHEQPLTLSLENRTFILHPLVEKRGFKVYLCESGAQGKIPANAVMSKIEHEVTRYAYEHLIIYVDAPKEKQVWQWVKRAAGAKSASRLNRFQKGQSGELLAQKVEQLAIALEEEDRLHMSDVAGRVARAFDVERVTRKFYDRFKLEHTAFLNLIAGIEARAEQEWYASLMLNRLMFIYFIQRKGFLDTHVTGKLDGDLNYLSNRLRRVQQERGANEFHGFYRYFLLRLFHDGLSKREHSPELEVLLGKVPYLNGGLFDLHILEHDNPEINIPDEAFETLFHFFDEFDWHLDDRPLRNDKEINPDVLGYIFEKYINQKQMGAYYTKEDITEYISKNTIIPYIFDAAESKCLAAFRPDGPIWSLLRENPDAYIYDAVKKGCDLPLPLEIEVGVQDVSERGEWNQPAQEEYALPTEIWREVVSRRTRYFGVRAKLAAGEITAINDLITYNLDLRRFAEDAITYCEGTDLLRAFYDSIQSVTVLDPTCGSGAFLFAALNILETLYEACLERMQDLVEEREALDAAIPISKRRRHSDINHFREILNRVRQHPSRTYFIYKSIIINNLCGVDIMEEATEICKLRLFLKLVSQIEKFDDIEPLPDIDFNIRAGNTLVGFASQEEVRNVIAQDLRKAMTSTETLNSIEQKAEEIERDFDNFRKLQTQIQLDSIDMAENKQQIRQKLVILRAELDEYLACEYGIDRHNIAREEEYDEKFAHWHQSHRPFHWWVEFYGIMKRGGFDVIIGNPPYVEYSKVRQVYQIRNYRTCQTPNLYAYIMERSLRLLHTNRWFGMIVPVSSISGESYKPLIEMFYPLSSWISSYSNRPGKLFAGVEQRLAIFIISNSQLSQIFASPYQHWYEGERSELFHSFSYVRASLYPFNGMPIKSGVTEAESIFTRLISAGNSLTSFISKDSNSGIWIHDGPTYWVRALPFEPNPGQKSERSNHYHYISAKSEKYAFALASVFSSSVFYFFFKMISNCRDLGQKEWGSFPFGQPTPDTIEALASLGRSLKERLETTALKCSRRYPSGTIEYEEYYPARAKQVIDEIDRVLAQHYGFTDEELDFVIHYDSKYRMGRP